MTLKIATILSLTFFLSACGNDGDTGPIGPTGSTGNQGPAGQNGPDGAVGAQGPQGEVGATGTSGSQGEVGPQGETGAQGEPGLNGSDGSAGTSGNDGLNSLITETLIDVESTQCSSKKALLVQSGVDLNSDGVLQAEEVTSSETICAANTKSHSNKGKKKNK